MPNLFKRRSKPPSVSSSSSTLVTTLTNRPPPPVPPVEPGDRPTALLFGRKITPIEVRDLSVLIRQRYALDVEIWGQRNCRPRDRPILEDKMKRADAALKKINSIIQEWDRREVWETESDWARLKLIRQRLELGGVQKVWANNAPWVG
jgi:hypothetical protein